jgi:hypothetical protein
VNNQLGSQLGKKKMGKKVGILGFNAIEKLNDSCSHNNIILPN